MHHNTPRPDWSVAIPVALRILGGLLVLTIGVCGLVLAGFFAYQFRELATQSDPPQQTHGLVFPASAVITSHDVQPDVVRLDGGATTKLGLPAADLPAFLAQLRVRQTVSPPTGPQTSTPRWMQTRYECDSSTGDHLQVDVSDPTKPMVLVEIYTDWN